MTKKYIIKNYTDLANPILGTKIISCSDEFFAPAKRLINPLKPIFKENVFDSHGKWMDGWETRRRRSPGFDFVIIKLGKPGKIKTVDIDTSFFNGNQPEYAQLEGCYSNNDNVKGIKWTKIIKKQKIKPNSSNLFKSLNLKTFTHIKLNIFPGYPNLISTQSKPLPLLLLVSQPLPILIDLLGRIKLLALPKCSSLQASISDPLTMFAKSIFLFFENL